MQKYNSWTYFPHLYSYHIYTQSFDQLMTRHANINLQNITSKTRTTFFCKSQFCRKIFWKGELILTLSDLRFVINNKREGGWKISKLSYFGQFFYIPKIVYKELKMQKNNSLASKFWIWWWDKIHRPPWRISKNL